MSWDCFMRTTLDIDTDVLEAVQQLAAQRGITAGKVISELARQALRAADAAGRGRHGPPLAPAREGERPGSRGTVSRPRDAG